MSGLKLDEGKPRIDLIDPLWLMELAKVLTFGAEKYTDHNWRSGLKWSRLYSATQRHLLAFHAGELLDPESGYQHLHHAACNLMMLAGLQRSPELNDLHPSNLNIESPKMTDGYDDN